MRLRLALLSGHYRADRSWSPDMLEVAGERLALWGAAADRRGEDPGSVIADLRERLADDLDTPGAVAVLDRWAADRTLAGAAVAEAVDALLGIDLRVTR